MLCTALLDIRSLRHSGLDQESGIFNHFYIRLLFRAASSQGVDRLQGKGDFLVIVEVTESETDRSPGEGPDRPVRSGCAMQSRSAEDTEAFIERQSGLGRRNTGDVKRDYGRPACGIGRPINSDAF